MYSPVYGASVCASRIKLYYTRSMCFHLILGGILHVLVQLTRNVGEHWRLYSYNRLTMHHLPQLLSVRLVCFFRSNHVNPL
ncbi:uncharacterized protein CYBJADRAFT_102504 [Cyberlindnera jadinii NRRL Y-1542]|uniref:Uncharacterized protein n=1 Tax=Cyberlindnera jadinii (strain ATCC 18201 / CBS 1600 / BCRC 20928 / JCM 3617 / NBRC 0987 / NRRL Y-1542) TaxID=983966 RepID=A0A1E4S030_CYBJN|nr:hypothetical protein CYBJADRAFT_102504 [Cyberlindnera jadinii NRRL Y-1542]ODV72858.1 hypothetical protein CYBJADRAFT_102504 [Cyberlindnera jadinii NRRL Y-1542]